VPSMRRTKVAGIRSRAATRGPFRFCWPSVRRMVQVDPSVSTLTKRPCSQKGQIGRPQPIERFLPPGPGPT
jgi:hypothetical protein